ncbi:MAG: phage tail protein [Microcella sp.]|uniref:phage tail protein n=1 Tax=Microcella sp. TaxID=1913979 RepID=UPI00331460EA
MSQTSVWGKITSTSPLRVQLDGDPEALPITPVSLIDPTLLNVDDMVFCERPARKVFIIGRAQGDGGGGFIGEHRAGEWATPPHPAWVLADGAVLNIADYPKLAAHYAATYGTSNHHGGNGTTTFAVPDTRERTYVNQGGSDVFANIGDVTGAKSHDHPLSDEGYAKLARFPSDTTWIGVKTVSGVPTWGSANWRTNDTPTVGTSTTYSEGVALGGSTDAASNVPPSFVCRYVIRAA